MITALTAVPMGLETVNSQDIKVYNVSSEEYLAGSKIIDDLTPETSYRVSFIRVMNRVRILIRHA